MNNIIITGAGKGLGQSLSIELANEFNNLFLIGRNIEDLTDTAMKVKELGGIANIIEYDLNNINHLDNLMKRIVKSIKPRDRKMFTLINNAGIIRPINYVGTLKSEEVEHNLRLNCMSAIMIINCFINETANLGNDIRVVNITSGVAKKPLPGWSLYSAGKAAVHSFISTIHTEQIDRVNPIKVVSLDPGVMNTGMQKYIRSIPKETFGQVNQFQDFYDKGLLRDTGDVARIIKKIYIDEWLAKDPFEMIWSYEKYN